MIAISNLIEINLALSYIIIVFVFFSILLDYKLPKGL